MFRQNRWLVLAIVSSALFLIIIDMTVLYTALPRLTHDLGATAAEKLWIVNAYPLVVAGLLPGAGLLSDRLGHKRLFLAGLPLFGLASLCAAFAPSAAALIAARAGLAVGAALMMPATLSIVRHVFQDERERALAIGIWASVASAGAALGPVVGGVLLEFFWWGSVFLINVPVVVVALLLALPAIPACGGQSRRPWDALGSLQVMFGLVGVVYAIKELSTRAPDFGLAVLAALGGMLCLYLFVRRQRRAREPMIDFALFRNRRFARGVAVALVATMALVGMELVFSQHLQLVQGLTPLKAGLFVLPIPLASLVVGPLAGWLVPRWGENRVMCASLLLGSAGLLGLALSYQSATGAQLASLVLLGVGFGGAMTAASTAVMLNVDEQSSGMAAAIEDVSYELGGVIGVTLLGSLMSFVYGMSLRLPSAELPARVRDSLDDALLVAEGLAPEVASRLVELARQAFDQAFVAVLRAALPQRHGGPAPAASGYRASATSTAHSVSSTSAPAVSPVVPPRRARKRLRSQAKSISVTSNASRPARPNARARPKLTPSTHGRLRAGRCSAMAWPRPPGRA